MTKIEFARELFGIGSLNIISGNISNICYDSDCETCEENNLKEHCDYIYGDLTASLSQEELEEFYETYPEVKIVL